VLVHESRRDGFLLAVHPGRQRFTAGCAVHLNMVVSSAAEVPEPAYG